MNKQKKERLIVWAAKGMFKSAYKLKAALQLATPRKVLVVRSDSPRFRPRNTDLTINWGNSQEPIWNWWIPAEVDQLYNYPAQISIAVNKLKTFQALDGKCNIPEWTTDPLIARLWNDVVIRNKLTGFGGEGIRLWNKEDAGAEGLFPEAPLYVQYKKKKKEFRVHVFKGEVIDVTQKKKRHDFDEEINTKIRNYANGWVYCREDIEEPKDLREQAIMAVTALGLDFGAVDCIWNAKESKSYVLEINTAPGIEETTLQAYKNAILKQLENN